MADDAAVTASERALAYAELRQFLDAPIAQAWMIAANAALNFDAPVNANLNAVLAAIDAMRPTVTPSERPV
jgi:hypothetical protein